MMSIKADIYKSNP